MRATGISFGLTLALSLALAGTAQAQLRYRVQSLGVLGAGDVPSVLSPSALNNHGTVVGYSSAVGDDQLRAFVYENGQARALGGYSGLTAWEAKGINDRGQIVGYASNAELSDTRGFIYENGQFKDLNPNPGFRPIADPNGINASGQVVGALSDGRAFVHDGTQLKLIPFDSEVSTSGAFDINDHGVAVGGVRLRNGEGYTFAWDGTQVNRLPDPQVGAGSSAIAINNAGQIAVNSLGLPYLYSAGTYQALGSLRGGYTTAIALNDKGWIVGWSEMATNPFLEHAFLWRNGRMRDLNDLLDATFSPHWELTSAMDINERGQIVGLGFLDGVQRGYIATPVPEAGTWALMLAGLGGVGAVAWRRRPGPRD